MSRICGFRVLCSAWRAKLPASAMYKAFRNRRIKVNGRRAAPDVLLCVGDVIELYLNDEFFEENASRPQMQAGWKKPLSHTGYL